MTRLLASLAVGAVVYAALVWTLPHITASDAGFLAGAGVAYALGGLATVVYWRYAWPFVMEPEVTDEDLWALADATREEASCTR